MSLEDVRVIKVGLDSQVVKVHLVYMKISNLMKNFLFDNLHYWTTI